MKKFIFILLSILFIIFAYYAYSIEPAKLNITEYKIKDEELKGIKAVFLSDFHLRPYQKDRLEKIEAIVNNENADIVFSAGDFVAGHTKNVTMQIEEIAEGLGKIKAKHGFYTVLGNHDSWYDKERIKTSLENNGIKVLENENVLTDIGDKTVYIAGVKDMQTDKPDIEKALLNTKSPIILLSHTPDLFPKVPETVNLTLAGHTHGGQVRLPLIGPVFTASKYFNRYAQGFVIENNKKIIISKGIGVSIIPIRFNCIPEIVIIEFE